MADLFAPSNRVRLAQDEQGCRHGTLDLDDDAPEVGVGGDLDVYQASESIRDEGLGRGDGESAADFGHARPLGLVPYTVAVRAHAHAKAAGFGYLGGHSDRNQFARRGI